MQDQQVTGDERLGGLPVPRPGARPEQQGLGRIEDPPVPSTEQQRVGVAGLRPRAACPPGSKRQHSPLPRVWQLPRMRAEVVQLVDGRLAQCPAPA